MMQKAKILLSLLLIATSPAIMGLEIVDRKPPKVIIWDVGGVLTKSPSICYHIGNLRASQIASTVSYMWEKRTAGLKTLVRGRFFEMLEAVYNLVEKESQQNPDLQKFLYTAERTRTADNIFMPHLLCSYQSGQCTAHEMRQLIDSKMEHLRAHFFSSAAEESILQASATTAFTPEKYAPSETPRDDTVSLMATIATLTTNGKKRFIQAALSNWDRESFALLKQLHPELFINFDCCFASGEEGLLKPNESAFRNVLKKLNVQTCDCIFIDDQNENIEAAERCGIRSHRFTTPELLTDFLLECGIPLPTASETYT